MASTNESSTIKRARERIKTSLRTLGRKDKTRETTASFAADDDRVARATYIPKIGVFDHDHRTDTLFWTPTMRALMGVDENTPASLNAYLNLVHGEDRPRVVEAIEYAHDPAGDGRFDVVHRLLRSDGKVRWCHLTSETQFEGEGDGRHPMRTLGTMVDITPTQRAQQDLQESKDRLRTILDGVHEFVGLLTLDGIVLDANRAALNYVDATRAEVVGKPFWETPWWRHSKPEQERLKAAICSAVKGELVRFETTHMGATGEVDDIDFALLPVCNDQNEITFLIPEGRRITNLKRLQRRLEEFNTNLEDTVQKRTLELNDTVARLAESEARMRAVVENAIQGIVTINEVGIMETANAAACKIFGYAVDELLGSSVRMLMPDPHRAQHDNYLANYLHSGKKKIIGIGRELQGLRKDGSIFPLDLAVTEGHVGGRRIFTGMMQDLTQRKAAENALRQSEQELRQTVASLEAKNRELTQTQERLVESGRFTEEVINSVNEGIVVYDRELRCIARNRFMAELSGIPNEAVLGHRLLQQFPELAQHGIDQALKRALSGETITVDHPLGRIRGTRRFLPLGAENDETEDSRIAWTWPTYHPYRNKNGEVIGVILVIADGTSRKHFEDEIKLQHRRVRDLAQQLERTVEQERRYLARELHDELAQLLTALRIDLGWLRRKFDASQSALTQRTLAMSEIVERIQSAVKRIAATLRPKILDERGLIPAIEALIREFSERTGIPCRFSHRPEELAVPDPQITMLYRIAQEGLTNIVKHAQADEVTVLLEETPKDIALSIRDNGKGLSEADQRKSNSFGLIGMRERVAAIHGTLSITSSANHGTLIMVRLPKVIETNQRSDDSRRTGLR